MPNSKGIDRNRHPDSHRNQGLATPLLRSGFGSVLIQGTDIVLSLGVAVLLARLLGAEGYGVYAFALALVSLGVLPAQAGLPPLVVRETARARSIHDWSIVRGIWHWANSVALALSVVIVTGGALSMQLGWVQSEALRDTLAWALGLVPVIVALSIRTASLRGLRHVFAGMLPDQVLRPALLAGALLVMWLLPSETLTPGVAMALTLFATLSALITGVWLLHRYRPPEILTAEPRYRHSSWLAAAWPIALTQGFQHINRNADVILLGFLAVATDVGVYRVAAQGAMLVSLALTALNMVIAPYATRLHTEQEQQQLQKLAQRTAQAAMAFALPATLLFIVFGEWILVTFFGDEFRNAYWPLLILAGGQLINAWFGPTGLLLTMTGHEREVTRAVAMAAGLNLALNIVLIPALDSIGAAIATSTSLAFWNIWLWQVVKKRLKILCSVF